VDFSYDDAQDQVTLDRYQSGQFVAQSVYQYNSLGQLVSLVDSQGSAGNSGDTQPNYWRIRWNAVV
jgi:YD repeat-containing protein